ncbi:MAG TPA: RcnB family protein [Allosphingosinicella sp.]|nr:RcnB family protein [Allosphingosinicella sp.]
MRKLSLTLLAASIAVLPAVASAQHGPRGGQSPGASWRGGGPHVQMRGPNVQMRGPHVRMRGPNMHGGNVRMHGDMRRGGGNFSFHRWGPHPGRNFRHSRLRRGFVINPFWFAPQFYIGNWQSYGFAAPGEDQRWVRYYDDAYLIDGGGRVHDERYGVDWDRHGEEWDDHDGIPGYRGGGGFVGNEYSEEHDEREEHHGARGGHHGGQGHGGPGYGPPPPGYGHGAAYGGGYYGYGAYAYPIVIETITTSGGGYSEEIVEEYVEVRQRHRARRPRPRCQCAPPPRPAPRRPAPRRPRPPAGERG